MNRPASLQQLAPQWAKLCLEVDAHLHSLAPNVFGATLVIACSGGIDSTALLHILAYLAPKNNFTLHVAHLDHALRTESSADRLFVERLCNKLSVSFHGKRVDIQKIAQERSVGIEEAGRLVRYDLFEAIRAQTNSTHILLGHHQGDLMEDVLLRLMRGAGWPGISGMVAVDNTRHILRPLLHISKQTLRSFLEAHALKWREDASNTDQTFARNRVRKEILPKILAENPGFAKSISRMHTQGAIDRNFFAHCIEAIPFVRQENTITFKLADILTIDPAIRLRLYKKHLDSLGAGQVRTDTLLELDSAVAKTMLPKITTFQFSGGKLATISGSKLCFSIPETATTGQR